MSRGRWSGSSDRVAPARKRLSLATGFRNVDRSGDPAACFHCLDIIANIPFFAQVKDESFRHIAESDPALILDAGCGNGTDLLSLASLLPPRSRIVGLDASASLTTHAAVRTTAVRDRVSIVRGDLLHIPCKSGSFDACRIDRVLQHIHRPEQVVRELARVLRPGGMLVAFDNDWETFHISLDDRKTAGRLGRFWHDRFASGQIGRELPAVLHESGFGDIRTGRRDLVLTDLAPAIPLFDLSHLLNEAEAAGVLAPATAASVREELHARERAGTFSAGYTGYLVRATKQANDDSP